MIRNGIYFDDSTSMLFINARYTLTRSAFAALRLLVNLSLTVKGVKKSRPGFIYLPWGALAISKFIS